VRAAGNYGSCAVRSSPAHGWRGVADCPAGSPADAGNTNRRSPRCPNASAPVLLPIFGGATIIATIAICLVIAFPSTAIVIVALATVVGFATALVAVLSHLIGPGPH